MEPILLVDDDPALRQVLARLLRNQGYDVCEANDGESALREFRARSISAVITDLVMPRSEGIELIQQLRRETLTLPIIAVSGAGAGSVYLRMAVHAGASASLLKPFKPQRLRMLLDLLQIRPSRSPVTPQHRLHVAKVVLACADDALRGSMTATLEQASFEVVAVQSVEQAAAEARDCDLVICDAAELVLTAEFAKHCPIITMPLGAEGGRAEKTRLSLRVPISHPDVLNCVREVLLHATPAATLTALGDNLASEFRN